MVREIVRDPLFLAQRSEEARGEDMGTARDLLDTLRANRGRCVGMAANMIGVKKRIIAVCDGPVEMIMVNPVILEGSGEYEAEEGCLSLDGTRRTKRYRRIRVKWQDMSLRERTGTFEGYTAQIIQHEADHCQGILI